MEKTLRDYKKITILGHDNIDVDAFLSGVLLSNLLNYLNIDNEFIILEEIKEDDTYQIVKELFGIEMRKYYSKGEDTERVLFLEDHYKTVHSGKVVACIDHHPTNEAVEYPFYNSRIACSTSYMIYEKMKEVGYPISNEEAKMIVVSMMVDTSSFRSAKTVQEEADKAKELANKHGLDYEELEKYCLCLTPIHEGIPVETIINNGYKNYNYSGNKVKSSYIQVYETIPVQRLNEWIKVIQEQVKNEKLAEWVFIIFDFKENVTYEYHVTHIGLFKEKITPGILSRGTNIMPDVEKFYTKTKC